MMYRVNTKWRSSPDLLKDHPIQYIYIPYEYVIDPVPSLPEEDTDDVTPPSPTARPEPTFYGGSNLTSDNYKPKVVEAVLKDLNFTFILLFLYSRYRIVFR